MATIAQHVWGESADSKKRRAENEPGQVIATQFGPYSGPVEMGKWTSVPGEFNSITVPEDAHHPGEQP